jgi:predicted metal-dependent enzyme (double-stranded beta helix superfamily)
MTTSEPYTLDRYVEDLQRISRQAYSEDEIIGQIAPLARRLAVDKSWLDQEHYMADPEQGFGVHVLHEEPDHSLAVFAVSWLPGRGTPPHDHGTWAIVAGVEGVERNVRYRRLDDRSRPDYAELEVKKEFSADAGDLVCMKQGGIHSVHNDTGGVTLSLHTYGKHVNYSARSQYDLETNEKKNFIVAIR